MKRTTFKLLGIILAVAGIITVIYTVSYIENTTYAFQRMNEDQPITISGETPFQRYLIGFSGLMMILLGYRSFKFIPPAERESGKVSEYDLDPQEN